MNVPNISQSAAGVTTLPRPEPGAQNGAARGAGAGESGRSARHAPIGNASFARLAWFDVNGDGEIDPRSAAAGGDAIMLVPAHSVDLPMYARSANPGGAHVAKPPATTERPDVGGPANAAQTNRAVEAYQRYGQAPASDPTSDLTPDPTPVPSAAPAAVVAVQLAASTATPPATTPNAGDLSPNTVAAPQRAVA